MSGYRKLTEHEEDREQECENKKYAFQIRKRENSPYLPEWILILKDYFRKTYKHKLS